MRYVIFAWGVYIAVNAWRFFYGILFSEDDEAIDSASINLFSALLVGFVFAIGVILFGGA